MRKLLLVAVLLFLSKGIHSQNVSTLWDAPGAGNPFIPGYFADPTIRKFGDVYYLYATTDGNGNGYGPAQVWMSYDFRNWTNMTMSWPATEVVWAPDVMQAKDGSYRYFYCQPCMIHEGVGKTPRGPWENVLGEDDAVLVPDRFVHNAITLDGQTFVDDDGATYIYFGTWGIYEGFGCGVARFDDDLKSFTDKRLIPNTEVKDFFEAPYVLKRNGTYYFMYSSGSCHDHTYRVQYATSTIGPMGPYVYQGCILETNADETVHGPGHHSVLKDGNDYYIVYHRHNIPRSIHGFHRQLCIDRLVFTPDGHIEKVVPTHEGVLPRSVADMPVMQNLAFGAKATASSYYSEDFRPSYATDDNNATLWKPASCTGEDYLEIDLGQVTAFDQVWTQFEYSTYFYQYKIETSLDGNQWTLYADKTHNTLAASPLVDRGTCNARYLRITVTGRQKNGHFGGIWNVKVFDNKQLTINNKRVTINNKRVTINNKKFTINNERVTINNKRGKRQTLALDVQPQLQVAVAGGSQWENNGGMLGGCFKRMPDGRMQATFGTDFLFAKGQPYTVTYQRQSQTIAYICDGKTQHCYINGRLQEKGRKHWDSPLTVDADITNLRIFSYALQPAEIAFYAQHPVEVPTELPLNRKLATQDSTSPSSPIVSISANDYPVGTTVSTIKNHPSGSFHGSPSSRQGERGEAFLQVELCQGRQAFRFTGSQCLRSDFPMPQTLGYSAPYTVSAWVLNPQVERVECIAQLMPVRNDLSTVELCNGSDPQNGLMMHNGTFENSGSPLITEREGQWQHWTVTYDGYMERQYLDGQLVNEKNMMLLLRPQKYMQIGASFDGSNPFDGYLHSLQVYDRTLSADEVRALYEQPTETDICLLIQPATSSTDWVNPGLWGGVARYAAQDAQTHGSPVSPYAGKLAILGPIEMKAMDATVPAATVTLAFALQKGAKSVTLLNAFGSSLKATPKGILYNGQLTKAELKPWNLLTITADGHCWLNGQPVTIAWGGMPSASAASLTDASMTIGDNKVAIASLLVTAAPVTEAEALHAYDDFSSPPKNLRLTLTATPITPQMVRLTLSGDLPADNIYRFTDFDGWTRDTSVLTAIDGYGRYSFQATALDPHGNVASSNTVTLTIDDSTFTTIADDFGSTSLDPEWRLLAGIKTDSVQATVADGHLTLQSAHGNFNANAEDNAVLLYREVKGDFVVQAHLTALMGDDRHNTPAYNEGGLMVLDDSRKDDQQIVQLGIFPNYNCGNMLTTVSHHGRRPQFPMGNGWQYEPYMQIERQGTTFYVRTSPDGRQWHEVAGSPVMMPQLSEDKPLKVGLFQVTYTERLGTASFDEFRLWQ